ncbi:MAG TPA: hypothetical protein VGH45_13355 [Solirubrobacteraceae bacterium]
MAAVALLIVIILIALGVHSCQVSARNSGLKDYNNNVSSLIQESGQTSTSLFRDLAAGGGQGNGTNLQNQINQTRVDAESQLNHARGLDVPDEVKPAQQNLLLVFRMRLDGITNIANQIQPALGTSTSKDAVNSIAASMARFYSSDVLYKSYTATEIANALHGAGIAVGPPNGETIAGRQFLPNVQWLTPSFIATTLGASAASGVSGGKVAPGLHGDSLDSVSVGGTTLQTGSTNTIPASPAPTFQLNFTNAGTNSETNVICKVSVTGTNVSGQTVVPKTTAGEKTSCKVTLSSSPSAGTDTVAATVEPVPGEKNKSNNSLSFPVTFQ